MKQFITPHLAVFCLCLPFLAACTNLHRTVTAGRDPASLKEVFVVGNLNDNHRLAELLAETLRTKGLRANFGPATLLPESAEAVLRYDDRWSWDFGEHMTYLRLDLHDPGEVRPYASATRTKYIATSTDVRSALAGLVEELFRPKIR